MSTKIMKKGLYTSASNKIGKGTFKDLLTVKNGNIIVKNGSVTSNSYNKTSKNTTLPFNGEDISEQSEYLRRRTVMLDTTDTLIIDNVYKITTGVLIHENEIYPDGSSNKVYVLTSASNVVYIPDLSGTDIPTESNIKIARWIKCSYYTKNDKRRLVFLRVVGYCFSNDIALCEFVDYDQRAATSGMSTWYTPEKLNTLVSAKLHKINLNNITTSPFKNGSKVIACGHTYEIDPFSITCGYVRSTTQMEEMYQSTNKTVGVTDYSYLNPPFSPYFVTSLNLGEGNNGCGIFLQNTNLELVGIHSQTLDYTLADISINQTASMTAEISPYVLNSNIFERMIKSYDLSNGVTQRIKVSHLNLNIYSTLDIMDKTSNDSIVQNCLLLDNIAGNFVNEKIDTSISIGKYTLQNIGNQPTFVGPDYIDTALYSNNYNLITKVEVLNSEPGTPETGNVISTYNIGDEYPYITLFTLQTLIEPETYCRIYFYNNLATYTPGQTPELLSEIYKLSEKPLSMDRQPYKGAYWKKN